MEQLLKQKLSKATPFMLLDEGKLDEGIFAFWKYLKTVNFLFKTKKKAKKEFISKLKKLAQNYHKNKDYKSAITCYFNIYKLDKNNEENIKNYITCLKEINQNDLEEALAKYLVKLNPTKDNFKILAQSYSDNKNYEKAIDAYKKYLNKDNLVGIDYSWFGYFYFCLYKETFIEQYAKTALNYFLKANEIQETKETIKNITSSANQSRKYFIELKFWKKYLKLVNDDEIPEDDKYRISLCAMKCGDFALWERFYNSRFKLPEGGAYYPDIKKPKYNSKLNIKNKTLLVHYEQGFGDTIFCFGYADRLKKLCKKLIFVVQDELVELLKNNDLGIEIYSKSTNLETIDFDYHLPMMDVTLALKISKNTSLIENSYVHAPKEGVEKYKKEFFNTPKLKVGISLSGNKKGEQKRDVPHEFIKIFDKAKNVQYYCLTKDTDDYKIDKIFKHNKIINIAKSFKNFSDTACAIENMDIVISSDNCILNLAGAMGKKVIGLFNHCYNPRWININKENSGFFASVLPIVNEKENEWENTVKKALDIIQNIK
ncbi:MAG: hypothetical protein IJ877_00285 [Candidatus Gastranaerophilales bacterium]|nr:hypothetical protein [Candidatus Gastranaerophilales bacterium]